MSHSNYERMDLFADILEPATMILADKKVLGVLSRREPTIRAVKYAIKDHKDEVIEILARIDGVSPEDYRFDSFRVSVEVLRFINRPEVIKTLREVFSLPQSGDAESSGAVTESTEVGAN